MEYKPTRQSRSDLPIGYQKNCLVVLMCNPSRVYAFWKVPEAGKFWFYVAAVLRAAAGRRNWLGLRSLCRAGRLAALTWKFGRSKAAVGMGHRSDGDFQAQLISNTLLLPEWNPNSAPQEGECQAVMVGYARRFSARC